MRLKRQNADFITWIKVWDVCCMICLFAFKCQFPKSLVPQFAMNVSVYNDTKFNACISYVFNWPFSIELLEQQQQTAEIRIDMLIPKRTKGCTYIVHAYLLCKLIAIHGRIKYHSFYCYGVPTHNIKNELDRYRHIV